MVKKTIAVFWCKTFLEKNLQRHTIVAFQKSQFDIIALPKRKDFICLKGGMIMNEIIKRIPSENVKTGE